MPGEHIRILHLEDRPLDAELIGRELKRANVDFSSKRVETEEEFRSALENSNPDVILADYHLPGFDGIGALKIAREVVPDIPFIFVSGSIGEERAVQALREGAYDYIIKDRPGRLPSAIDRALSDRRERMLRQRAQESLRRSEERYQYAANATQEVILDWNLRSDKVTFNEALRSIWGYQTETDELSAEWFFARIHPDEREKIETSKRKTVAARDRWEGSYRMQAADGTYRHVLEHAVVIPDAGGRPLRVICALLDVTEQKVTEELMARSERRFRSLAQTASDAIVITDADGIVMFINEVGEKYFGHDAQELLGNSMEVLVPERNRERYCEGIEEIRLTGKGAFLAGTRQINGLRKDGTEFPIDVSMTAWQVDGSTFLTSFVRDATARVEQERRQKMELAVARVLAEAESAHDGMQRMLREIVQTLGWKIGFYWQVSEDRESLRCTETWAQEGFDASELFQVSRSARLRSGEGTPGRVLQFGQPVVVSRFPEELDTARIAPALKTGLASGFGLPIIEASGVTGVLEFYDVSRLQQHDAQLVTAMTDVGRRIGEFLQRGRAEEGLRSSEVNLAEAQRIARMGSYSFHIPSGTVEWSAGTYAVFGVSPSDFRPSVANYLERVHHDDRHDVSRTVMPPYPAELVELHHRIVCGDGEVRYVDCSLRVMEGTAREPVRVLGTIQDVTKRIEAEDTILRLSRQNRSILDSAAEAIIGTDPDGRATFVNPAALALTGFSAEELRLATTLHGLLKLSTTDGAPLPAEDCPVMQTIHDGKVRRGQAAFRKKTGELFPVEFATAPMITDTDSHGCVLSFTDITERFALERRLEQANRVSSLGRVAATIAHEFNNVLMGIQPFAEVIRRRPNSDEKTKGAASQIIHSVERGKRVTEEILRFSQPSKPAMQPTIVSEWLTAVLPELQGLAGKRVQIELDLPDAEVACEFDSAQMHQVITNLVLNGRDAIEKTGTIIIGLDNHPQPKTWPFGQMPDGSVVLSITDSGSGMPPAVMANIFEPLFTTKRSGTGLGLAVVHQIMVAHHGSIHVSSTPGRGTTFYLVLPECIAAEAPVVETHPAQSPNVRDVLLVEDESIVAEGITALLESDGIEVRVAGRGGEVIGKLEERLPDLVILDVSLPDINGPEVYKMIAERWPSLPVIFSTGHADESALEKTLSAPHVGFLRKPYDYDTLLLAIERVLQQNEVSQ